MEGREKAATCRELTCPIHSVSTGTILRIIPVDWLDANTASGLGPILSYLASGQPDEVENRTQSGEMPHGGASARSWSRARTVHPVV